MILNSGMKFRNGGGLKKGWSDDVMLPSYKGALWCSKFATKLQQNLYIDQG